MPSAKFIGRIADACRRIVGAARAAAPSLALALALAGGAPAKAQVLDSEAAPTVRLHVPVGKSASLPVSAATASVVVAQPDTAKVGPGGRGDLYVMGRDIGTTNILVYDRDARLIQVVDVAVGYDAGQIEADIAAALPGEHIAVTDLSQGVILTGRVSTSEAARTAMDLAQRAAPDAVISRLDVQPSQVLLKVRLVETSSSHLRAISAALSADDHAHLGVSVGGGPIGPEAPFTRIDAPGGSGRFDLDARLQALEQKGQLRILAQPTLSALTGERASFRAGGEAPFPVPEGLNKVAVEFRPYGTALSFQPDIQANGFIRVALTAEVSGLDRFNGLRLSGVTVPGLAARRVSTAADLRSGETLMFAGLLQDDARLDANGTPLLSRIPLLGPALESWRGKRSRRELAIFVTPRLLAGPATPDDLDLARLAEAAPPPRPTPAAAPRAAFPQRLDQGLVRLARAAMTAPKRGLGLVHAWADRLRATATAPAAHAEVVAAAH